MISELVIYIPQCFNGNEFGEVYMYISLTGAEVNT